MLTRAEVPVVRQKRLSSNFELIFKTINLQEKDSKLEMWNKTAKAPKQNIYESENWPVYQHFIFNIIA